MISTCAPSIRPAVRGDRDRDSTNPTAITPVASSERNHRKRGGDLNRCNNPHSHPAQFERLFTPIFRTHLFHTVFEAAPADTERYSSSTPVEEKTPSNASQTRHRDPNKANLTRLNVKRGSPNVKRVSPVGCEGFAGAESMFPIQKSRCPSPQRKKLQGNAEEVRVEAQVLVEAEVPSSPKEIKKVLSTSRSTGKISKNKQTNKKNLEVVLLKSNAALKAQELEEARILREFDQNMNFGPGIGLTRLERWVRARDFGREPAEDVRRILESHVVDGKWQQPATDTPPIDRDFFLGGAGDAFSDHLIAAEAISWTRIDPCGYPPRPLMPRSADSESVLHAITNEKFRSSRTLRFRLEGQNIWEAALKKKQTRRDLSADAKRRTLRVRIRGGMFAGDLQNTSLEMWIWDMAEEWGTSTLCIHIFWRDPSTSLRWTEIYPVGGGAKDSHPSLLVSAGVIRISCALPPDPGCATLDPLLTYLLGISVERVSNLPRYGFTFPHGKK
ncbi:hypothetical protein BDK51DRAFT_29741 [Blyttiomyces helicus]|uniref:Uncharacterized protein n=1 Tax=Blyttiomyces helicus TaxID=388810 RepID=A0A4V1IRG8_9FUNG|nr:hypothetical protein BDK51DRAFT_29741 [Blyttiomyces helicus]|eukprot:RKO90007.1 hypothetical protein BDK51DRAFT_29741 [Blyttiomyces helicus]